MAKKGRKKVQWHKEEKRTVGKGTEKTKKVAISKRKIHTLKQKHRKGGGLRGIKASLAIEVTADFITAVFMWVLKKIIPILEVRPR